MFTLCKYFLHRIQYQIRHSLKIELVTNHGCTLKAVEQLYPYYINMDRLQLCSLYLSVLLIIVCIANAQSISSHMQIPKQLTYQVVNQSTILSWRNLSIHAMMIVLLVLNYYSQIINIYCFVIFWSVFYAIIFIITLNYYYEYFMLLTKQAMRNNWEEIIDDKPDAIPILKVSVNPSKPKRLIAMTDSLSLSDVKFYLYNVSLNFQLNNMLHYGLTLYYYICKPIKLKQACMKLLYMMLLNTSTFSWIRCINDDLSDCHIIFENMYLVSGRNNKHGFGVCGGNDFQLYKKIVIHLDARKNYEIVTGMDLIQDNNVNIYLSSKTDAYEISCLCALITGICAHPQTHLLAAEITRCDPKKWPISNKIKAAANGINFAAVNVIDYVFMIPGEKWSQRAFSNFTQGFPLPHRNTKLCKFLFIIQNYLI
eukprot:163161_1